MSDPAFRFSTPIEIRFSDIDAFGHVNNAVYFTYFEMARVAYLAQVGVVQDEFPNPFFIIAEATCQFKAPVRLQTRLLARVRLSRMGNASFDFEYQLVDAATDQIMAQGRTVQVVFDYQAGRSVPLPAAWRAAMQEFEAS